MLIFLPPTIARFCVAAAIITVVKLYIRLRDGEKLRRPQHVDSDHDRGDGERRLLHRDLSPPPAALFDAPNRVADSRRLPASAQRRNERRHRGEVGDVTLRADVAQPQPCSHSYDVTVCCVLSPTATTTEDSGTRGQGQGLEMSLNVTMSRCH